MIRVVGWDKFQHYSDRRMVWVKLHLSLLDKREWCDLPDRAARLLVECWMLAGRGSEPGAIGTTVAEVSWALRKPEKKVLVDLQLLEHNGFIEMSSRPLAEVEHLASLEERREEEKRVRARRREMVRQVFDYWVASRPSGARTPNLSAERSSAVTKMVDAGRAVDEIKKAIDGCMGSDFHVSGGHTDLTLICKDESKLDAFIARAPAPRPQPDPTGAYFD